jgi:hypothetical protein
MARIPEVRALISVGLARSEDRFARSFGVEGVRSVWLGGVVLKAREALSVEHSLPLHSRIAVSYSQLHRVERSRLGSPWLLMPLLLTMRESVLGYRYVFFVSCWAVPCREEIITEIYCKCAIFMI